MAFKSIVARRGRTFLTMLGIIIGLAAVITQITYVKGQSKEIMAYYESMGTNQIQISAYKWGSGSANLFQSLYDYCLQLDDLVEGVTPNVYIWGTVQYGTKNSDTMDYSPQLYLGSDQWSLCNNFTISQGRDLTYLDIKAAHQVCVLGSRAKELFFDYSDPIGKTITLSGVPFEVVGVYARKDFSESAEMGWSLDNVIVFPYSTTRALAASGQDYSDMSEFVAKAKSREALTEAVTRLDGFLAGLIGDPSTGNSYGHYSVYSPEQGRESTEEANKKQENMMAGVAAISLLVGGIGIMNTMLVTVTERTREIGIRKAIGAERRSIIAQFLIEACIICGIGGLLGILASYPACWIYCRKELGYIVNPDASIMITGVVVSVLLGVVFGMYPAIKASGLQPVDALRAE
nr:ABC transporter permease [Pseudoflavonifractor sp. 524-17]